MMTVDEAMEDLDPLVLQPEPVFVLAAEVKRLRGQLAVETIPVQLELNRKLHEEVERLRAHAAAISKDAELFADEIDRMQTTIDSLREENARLKADLGSRIDTTGYSKVGRQP